MTAILVPFFSIYAPLAYAEGSSSTEEIDKATAAAAAELAATGTADSKVPAFDDTQSQVFLFVRSGKFEDATKLVNDALAGAKNSDQQTNLLY